jgi:hypothetical protein
MPGFPPSPFTRPGGACRLEGLGNRTDCVGRKRPEIKPKTKDPSGGTTGRVKLYGRLGWMGVCAEYSLVGEGLPLPHILVAQGRRTFKQPAIFFNFWLVVWMKNYCAAGRLASPTADLSEAMAAPGAFKSLVAGTS